MANEEKVENEAMEESKDGHYTLVEKEDGVYLTVFPPKEGGSEIDFSKVRADLLEQRLIAVDMDTVERIVSESAGDEYKITEDHNITKQIDVDMDPEKMKAYLTLNPPDEGTPPATYADVIYALKKNGIVYGIKKDEIENLIDLGLEQENVVVAEGKEPVNGDDAKMVYMFDIDESLKPKEFEDGSVDHYDLGGTHNVEEDQTLVIKIPATVGDPGHKVDGEEIPAKMGKDVPFPKGEGTDISPDGLELFAVISGQRRTVAYNNEVQGIKIEPIFKVPKDVDFSTGNINFVGDVMIEGSVRDGFKVESGGNIDINGTVEGAEINSKGGSIKVKIGIQGHHKAVITAQTELKSGYIMDSEVTSYGDVMVDTTIRHSQVNSKKKVIVKNPKGEIVGGVVRAAEEIEVRFIGSPSYTATEVRIEDFTLIKKRKKLTELKEKIKEGEKNLERLSQIIEMLKTSGNKIDALPKDKKDQILKQVQVYPKLQERVNAYKQESDAIEATLKDTTDGRIKVLDTIYPNVKVAIGNSTKNIDTAMQYVVLYESDDGTIESEPLSQ